MQTSANVSRPPLDAARTPKDQPGENSQFASTASQRFTGGLVRLNCDCGAVGFNSIVTLLILPVNLKGTACDQATAVPSPKPISAPSSAEKDIGLCPVTSAGAECCAATSPTAREVIVTSKNECVSFLNLSNLLVHFNRHNHPRSTHSTRHFFLDPTADVTVKNDSTGALL